MATRLDFSKLIGADLPPEEDAILTNSLLQMMATLQGKSVEEVRKQNILDLLPEDSDARKALNDLVKSLKDKK